MAATLREWLNVQGYDSVHFALSDSTVILWGTVPNEFERRWVRSQATMLTGATAVIDHIVIGADPSASSE
jgi:osmotically-inducible protein OsmY